jgi:hypothetical protein
MGFGYRWHPSRSAAREFAEKMDEVGDFCRDNGISQSCSGDSYYFSLNGIRYRVSNHTVEASNRGAFSETGERLRMSYHPNGRQEDTVYITAGKTRIIEIYTALKAGKQLDGRGYEKR